MEPNKNLNPEIDHILNRLAELDPDTEEYTAAVQNLKTLYEARAKRQAFFIEPETILVVVANLLGILAILKYEEFNVVSSRAFGLVFRPK